VRPAAAEFLQVLYRRAEEISLAGGEARNRKIRASAATALHGLKPQFVEAVVGKSLWEDPWFFAASPDREEEPRSLCPITGYPCDGDLSYLCREYGCARKGGLSPRSEENF